MRPVFLALEFELMKKGALRWDHRAYLEAGRSSGKEIRLKKKKKKKWLQKSKSYDRRTLILSSQVSENRKGGLKFSKNPIQGEASKNTD